MEELGRMMENDTSPSPGLVGRRFEGLQREAGGNRENFLGGSGVGWGMKCRWEAKSSSKEESWS